MASPSRKKVKTQPPDVIVSVGSGDSVQEFECYKVVLAFASDYLDTMLSSSMKEGTLSTIEFPDKDPEEWKLFYEFIAPQQIGEAKHHAVINKENVMTLLPWFHEFQMDGYVKECDKCLALTYSGDYSAPFWETERSVSLLEQRKDKFDKMIHALRLACMYDLKSTTDVVGGTVAGLIRMPHTDDLFDLAVVKSLLQTIPPLHLEDNAITMKSGGGCMDLWLAFGEIISPHISNLSQKIIDDDAIFPLLVHSYMQSKGAIELKNSATSIINTFIHHFPNSLNSIDRTDFKSKVARYYEDQKNEFNKLGIHLPSTYNRPITFSFGVAPTPFRPFEL